MRLFISIDLDKALKDELARAARPLRKTSPYGMSLSPIEQFHITLKFLGEVEDNRIPALLDALTKVAKRCHPFSFKLGPLECYPNHGPLRLIWMRPVDELPADSFQVCREACESELVKLGSWQEEAPFLPHITISRIQRDNQFQSQLRTKVPDFKFDPLEQHVTGLSLYKSELSVHGAIHALVDHVEFPKTR